MCDPIRTDTQVDGLSALVELVQYPDAYDGPEGDELADLLSEIASALVDHQPAGFTPSPGASRLSKTHIDAAIGLTRPAVFGAVTPQEARRALVDGAWRFVAMIRAIDMHMAAHGADAPFAAYDWGRYRDPFQWRRTS